MSPFPAQSPASRVCLRFSRWLMVALCSLALWPAAHAAVLDAADELAVRNTVQAQLAAFAADDAPLAFSYAAPNVREAMGSAAAFLVMVREAYPVVYRPASVAFLKAESREGQVVQRVQMTDAAGQPWLAIYSLQRGGKGWLITGCVVVANKGRMA